MASPYPGAYDTLNNPSGTDYLAVVDHAGQHTDVNNAVEAIQAELGLDPAGSYPTVAARLAKMADLAGHPAGTVFYIASDGTPVFIEPTGLGGKFLRFNLAENALEAATVPIVVPARNWSTTIGTRYRARFDDSTLNNGNPASYLGSYGWSRASGPSIQNNAGSAHSGDLNASDDDTPQSVLIDSAAEGLIAPPIVGGWAMLQAVKDIIGAAVSTITVKYIGRFVATTADTVNTTISGFGLTKDSLLSMFSADSGGIVIGCGATNFSLSYSGGAFTDLGVAKDTNWHEFEFVIDVANSQLDVKIDGTEVASDVSLSVTDVWPMSPAFGSYSSYNNNIECFIVGVDYD